MFCKHSRNNPPNHDSVALVICKLIPMSCDLGMCHAVAAMDFHGEHVRTTFTSDLDLHETLRIAEERQHFNR